MPYEVKEIRCPVWASQRQHFTGIEMSDLPVWTSCTKTA